MQIIIVGGGKTGTHLASTLVADGASVTVIESRSEAVALLQRACPHARIIEGNGSDPQTLEAAGIRIADAVAAVTGKDETNLVISMLAKMEFAAPRVVARVNDPANAWMFTPANGVDVGVNQAEITGRFVLEGINVHDVYTLMKLGRDEHRIVQATVGVHARVAGMALSDIPFPTQTIVVAVDHQGDLTVPNGATKLQPGDEAVIFTSDAGTDEIRRLFS